MSIEAMKQALEALEFHYPTTCQKEIEALRQAIAEAEKQEPVACQYAIDVCMPEYRCVGKCQYESSPQRQWVGLTDDEMKKTWYEMQNIMGWYSFQEIAKAIEARLRSKNNG